MHFPPIETHLIESRHVAQTFRVRVMQPVQERSDSHRFPVVYVTDGNALFDICKGSAALLQAFRVGAPRFILVAIGYPSDSPVAGERLRGRDLGFEGCPDFLTALEILNTWEDILPGPTHSVAFGEAARFTRFLRDELIPFVDGHYPTTSQARTYFGHSLGGGFGLFTLFTQPRLFTNYIVSSPTVTFCGTTAAGVRYQQNDFLIDRASSFLATRPSLEGIQLYVSVGTEEEYEPQLSQWRFTSGFHRLVGVLRGAESLGLRLVAEALPGELHSTAPAVAFAHGVRALL